MTSIAKKFPHSLHDIVSTIDHVPASLPNTYGPSKLFVYISVKKRLYVYEWTQFYSEVLGKI